MWRSTLYRQLVSSRAAGGPAPALTAAPALRVTACFAPVLPACASHRCQNENIHSLSHLTPLTPPGRRPAEASSVRSAPSSSTSLSPRGGDGPKTTLSHRCDGIGVRLRYVARPARLAGRLTTWPNNLPSTIFDGRATCSCSWRRQVITSLLPTCLRVAGKVVSRRPAV